MHKSQRLRRNHQRCRNRPVCIPQFLMNTPLVASSFPPAKDARRIGVKQCFPGLLINIMPRN